MSPATKKFCYDYAAPLLLGAVLCVLVFTLGLLASKVACSPAVPPALAAPVSELEPSAAPEYLPARHVCPTCPYRHYPAQAIARPFNVTCPFCRNVILATPPLGQLGDTVEPEK